MDNDKEMHLYRPMILRHEREPMIADEDMSMIADKQRLFDEMHQPRKKLRLMASNNATSGNGNSWFRNRIKHLSTGVVGKIARS